MALAQTLPTPTEMPVSADEFADALDRLAPFEDCPHLAVAVSGGSDSMALVLLAQEWTRARGGTLTALTVDHGLRAEAAAEARQVATWCAARGIAHVILRRDGPHLISAIQHEARIARYRLLEEWCAAHAVLHVLVAHQREDQAETILMRQAHGSGATGLAGMASIVERGACRLLRPLLGFPRARLAAVLDAADQAWIDDPSNRNPAFLRVRWRGVLDAAPQRGIAVARLAAMSGQFARIRRGLEADIAACLARAVTLDPGGFAWIDGTVLAAGGEAGRHALAAVIMTVSGSAYPPRRERLERLFALLPDRVEGGRSLGGCLVLPRRGRILVCREPAAVALPVQAVPGGRVCWDGRFVLDLPAKAAELSLGALGADAAEIEEGGSPALLIHIPPAARAALPALRDAKGVVAVPSLEYFSKGWLRKEPVAGTRLIFSPTRPLTSGGFTIV